MASNSDALSRIASDLRDSRATVENPEGGVWPVGGNPVPDANTAVENNDAADVPSGKIESDTATPSTEAEPDNAPPAVADKGESTPTTRRAASGTKAGPAKA